MKRAFCFLLIAALLLSSLPVFAEELSKPETITEVMLVANCNKNVSLRSAPDKNAKRLKWVYKNELVLNCYDAGNGFVCCSWNNTVGYIDAQYLKATSYSVSSGIIPNQMVYNVKNRISMRDWASTSANRVIQVPVGAIVTTCTTAGLSGWVHCEYKGKWGYIETKYLKKADYETAAPIPEDNEGKYPAMPYTMEVVNCKTAINLRRDPDSTAFSLMQVPLGSLVTDCVRVSKTFVSVVYDGVRGYVNGDYLAAYQPPTPVPAPVTPAPAPAPAPAQPEEENGMPSLASFSTWGQLLVDYSFNGYRVMVRWMYVDDGKGGEAQNMVATCYDPAGKPVWCTGDLSGTVTELLQVDAFIAGTADRPLVVLFTAGHGFTAYEIGPWTGVQWQCAEPQALAIAGGTSTAVDRDGTIYCIGYHDYAPTCISPDGHVLWVGRTPDTSKIYWPYEIIVLDNGIEVLYESLPDDSMCYAVDYTMDGQIRQTRTMKKPNA